MSKHERDQAAKTRREGRQAAMVPFFYRMLAAMNDEHDGKIDKDEMLRIIRNEYLEYHQHIKGFRHSEDERKALYRKPYSAPSGTGHDASKPRSF